MFSGLKHSFIIHHNLYPFSSMHAQLLEVNYHVIFYLSCFAFSVPNSKCVPNSCDVGVQQDCVLVQSHLVITLGCAQDDPFSRLHNFSLRFITGASPSNRMNASSHIAGLLKLKLFGGNFGSDV